MTLLASSWQPWLPAGAFHFLTKDASYIGGDWTLQQQLQAIPATPPPDPFKTTDATESISLPSPERQRDTFFQTLHARRTQREFADAPVPLDSVAQLLHTTWGVQAYIDTDCYGSLPLKTSPSGGARHPIEVYLMALRVKGLDRGLYHYDARTTRSSESLSGATSQMARAYCADQPYVARSAALFIMTGVFARTMWKYHHPRAYRVVLLDAGHLGQTFCLTATRLGLAPFSTAALKDTLIEEDLGIDGISESVLYVTGVGMPSERAVDCSRGRCALKLLARTEDAPMLRAVQSLQDGQRAAQPLARLRPSFLRVEPVGHSPDRIRRRWDARQAARQEPASESQGRRELPRRVLSRRDSRREKGVSTEWPDVAGRPRAR